MPSRGKEVTTGPIVTVGQKHLPVEHDLVFLQTTFSTKGLGVDGIPTGNPLLQFLLQALELGSTVNNLLAEPTKTPVEASVSCVKSERSRSRRFSTRLVGLASCCRWRNWSRR